MTKILPNGRVQIEVEPPRACQLCGRHAECRPYGPNGEDICFDCGQKTPVATAMAFARFLLSAQ